MVGEACPPIMPTVLRGAGWGQGGWGQGGGRFGASVQEGSSGGGLWFFEACASSHTSHFLTFIQTPATAADNILIPDHHLHNVQMLCEL